MSLTKDLINASWLSTDKHLKQQMEAFFFSGNIVVAHLFVVQIRIRRRNTITQTIRTSIDYLSKRRER